MATPTSLSLRLLRRRGYLVDVCERWVPHVQPPIRKDLFGAFDVVGLHLDVQGVLGVQTTSAGCLSARVSKLRQLPSVAAWLRSGNGVQLHGWRKIAGRWRVKIIELQRVDLEPITLEQPRRRLPKTHEQRDLWDLAPSGENAPESPEV
jgi:hypothetical protein